MAPVKVKLVDLELDDGILEEAKKRVISLPAVGNIDQWLTDYVEKQILHPRARPTEG